ncbi:MAG: GNAT family N-acetyltransferase [Anaerorhabdus sp.]|uniref:GNAT family N-acetyltransferase n=1 Tax=Anaerorhabdus sp. TaxID=1872524 RepID=UPI002B1EF4B7|nr:GNAT family N-acetyltransferase [Anaerorhabdus sp.]MEA4875855.1 GNAT family N-acetyltransferase [Anaerorhabdus sp.]
MSILIRVMRENEYPLLETFLYEAIFIPEGTEPPSRMILEQPELQLYIKNFGMEKDDKAFVAEINKKIVGAVWVRIMNDYGHIDDNTPSFAISLLKEYRGLGIGKTLMQTMLSELKKCDYKQVSLAVQKENFALKLYKNLGFEVFDENEEEYIMILHL